MTDDQSYTPEEIELLREQLRRGVEAARLVAENRGIRLHPRLAELCCVKAAKALRENSISAGKSAAP